VLLRLGGHDERKTEVTGGVHESELLHLSCVAKR
jgi:hypothetical protein